MNEIIFGNKIFFENFLAKNLTNVSLQTWYFTFFSPICKKNTYY